MFGHSKIDSTSNENVFFDYFKGLLVASFLSFGLIILFAFCLKWFSLSDVVIAPINLAIKGLCVIIGSAMAIKGKSKGLIKGAIFGIIYILFAFVLFSILAGSFSVGVSLVLDCVFAMLLGGIVGVIKVNKN